MESPWRAAPACGAASRRRACRSATGISRRHLHFDLIRGDVVDDGWLQADRSHTPIEHLWTKRIDRDLGRLTDRDGAQIDRVDVRPDLQRAVLSNRHEDV